MYSRCFLRCASVRFLALARILAFGLARDLRTRLLVEAAAGAWSLGAVVEPGSSAASVSWSCLFMVNSFSSTVAPAFAHGSFAQWSVVWQAGQKYRTGLNSRLRV